MLTTTINMHRETYTAISTVAKRLAITRRAVIVRLLMRIMRDIEGHHGGFTTVRYQPAMSGGEWHCFSIRFKPDENEYFHDLRNFCKCSVSYLLAMAAEKYMGELFYEKCEHVHKNAWFSNYIIHREVSDGIVCWRICWGYRRKHARSLLQRQ